MRTNVLMQARYTMPFIVVASFVLSLNTIRIFDLQEVNTFLTVIGLIYGLIAAFTINNAWERFSKIRDAIAVETNSLATTYIYSKNISDKKSAKQLKNKLIEYCKEVPKVDWPDYWDAEKVHKKFRDLIEITSKIKFKNEKDIQLFDEISEELRSASSARNSQLVLSRTRLSKFQWLLNIFLSLVLIGGVVFLKIPDYTTTMTVSTLMITSVMFILLVTYELDTLRTSDKEVSIDPWLKVAKLMEKD